MTTPPVRRGRTPVLPSFNPAAQIQRAQIRQVLRSPQVQAKLAIGQPNDKYEQEADRVADEVMRMPEPEVQRQVEPEEEEEETLQAKPLAEQITPLVQRQMEEAEEEEEPIQAKLAGDIQLQRQEDEPEEEEETLQAKPLTEQITPLVQSQVEPEEETAQPKMLQRQAEEEEEPVQTKPNKETVQAKNIGSKSGRIVPNIESSINSIRGDGQPLSESNRAFFESRFDADFSGVKVHTGANANHLAKSINAKAFTVGRDVVFGSGQYSPESSSGKQLLAHELTHHLQQMGRTEIKPQFFNHPATSSLEPGSSKMASSSLRQHPQNIPHRVSETGRECVQKLEHGTYISNQGSQEYLRGAEQFYRSWNYPNVRRVNNVRDILTDLNRRVRGEIDTFRIVSHAEHGGLLLGLLPDFFPNIFDVPVTRFSTSEPFRYHWMYNNLAHSTEFLRFMQLLRENDTTLGFLQTLGAQQGIPSEDSPIGIILRAVLDSYYLRNVRLSPSGGVPDIPNRRALTEYNNLRLTTYRRVFINAVPSDRRTETGSALQQLIAEVPQVIRTGNMSFTVTQSDAQTMGQAYSEMVGRRQRLRRDVRRAISEGADGPFVRLLNSIKGKITPNTHVKIRGCTVGSNVNFLDGVRSFFRRPARPAVQAQGNRPAQPAVSEAMPVVSAPDIFQYFFSLHSTAYDLRPDFEQQLAQQLQEEWPDIESSYHRMLRLRNREMIQVVDDRTTLEEFCRRYGLDDIALIRQLNPNLDPNDLSAGDVVWLKAVPILAGNDRRLEDFCQTHLHNRYLWPRIWSYNPEIQDPSNLASNDPIWVVPPDVRLRAGEAEPTLRVGDYRTSRTSRDFISELRAGGAIVGIAQGHPHMRVGRQDRAAAVADWLARQGFSPTDQTAASLTRRYRRNFTREMARTHIQFLSRHNRIEIVSDPIFPEDPRYGGHIITRP